MYWPCVVDRALSRVYPYMADMLTLAGRRAPSLRPGPAVSGWDHIQTPMPAEVWE